MLGVECSDKEDGADAVLLTEFSHGDVGSRKYGVHHSSVHIRENLWTLGRDWRDLLKRHLEIQVRYEWWPIGGRHGQKVR